MRAEDFFEESVEQWIEQTNPTDRTFDAFRSFMKLAGFDWGREWMEERFDELDQAGVSLSH